MLGGVQFETGGVGPVPYLNILGGTSQKKHPVSIYLLLVHPTVIQVKTGGEISTSSSSESSVQTAMSPS